MEFQPVTPKDAAAVILVRGDQVLWARRNPNLKFLGGFHAFPGGKTDPEDRAINVENCDDAEMSAMLACAVREVFEEVGVLLVRGGEKLTKGQRFSLHDDLISGRSKFGEILADWGLWIDAADFIYTGFWTTPQFSPVRFKTRFFIAQCPPKQTPYAAISELENIEFIAAVAALKQWERSEVLISPPVLISLKALAGNGETQSEKQDSEDRIEDGNPRFSTTLRIRGEELLEKSSACGGNIEFIELNPRLVCIPLRTKTLPPATHTNCFVVGKREFVVIDAASPYEEEQSKLLELIGKYIESGCICRSIIVSHLHNDHFGGEMALQKHLATKFGMRVPIAGQALTIESLKGKVEFQQSLQDGEAVELVDANGVSFKLEILHTPGHARGHLAFYDREMRFLLSSDNVVGTGTVVIAPPEGHMNDYLRSLRRMRELPGLRFLAGSHGAAIFDAKGKIDQYISHRAHREKQILNALGNGAESAEDIAKIIYPEIDPALFRLAAASVSAHLAKIDEDKQNA
ncbi:MAG: MBL fold metallo-hydrolase [Acidobacteria bacterium]|nr:MBL fold metallo-hydrolase [Acidobacteriota bacterium]